MIEIIIILAGAAIIGLWALKWACYLLGMVLGGICLALDRLSRSEPKQEPLGYSLDEILADDRPTINLN